MLRIDVLWSSTVPASSLTAVLAAFFGHGRNGHADDFAVVHGVEPVLAGADGLFDGRDQGLLPGLNQNQVRFRGGDLRNL